MDLWWREAVGQGQIWAHRRYLNNPTKLEKDSQLRHWQCRCEDFEQPDFACAWQNLILQGHGGARLLIKGTFGLRGGVPKTPLNQKKNHSSGGGGAGTKILSNQILPGHGRI